MGNSRSWPVKALAWFILVTVALFSLILFTGDRQAAPRLGIDLQGGTRVTLVPQGDEPTQDQLDQARAILEQRVNGMGVSGAQVVADGNTLVITVPGEDTAQARAVGQTSQLLFRPVAQQPTPNPAKLAEILGDMANRWVEYDLIDKTHAEGTIDRIYAAFEEQEGQSEATAGVNLAEKPKITTKPKPEPANSLEQAERREKTTKMLIEDRQSEDPTTQAAASALMTCDADVDPLSGADDPARPLVTCDYDQGHPYLLQPAPLLNGITDSDGPRLTGNEIDTNSPINGGFNQHSGQMEISFAFKTGSGPSGAQTWADLTQEYLQQQIAITLDSNVISAPVIQGVTPYGSTTSITGQFSQEEAQELANNLRYGALPLSFVGEDGTPGGTAETVPPSLGQAALKAGLIAGLVGLALIAVFVFYYYRLLALISLVSLAAAGLITYAAIVLLGRWIGYSLDLSGIAGLIIGIATAADSFVVLYERIKDELLQGRTFRSAAPRAWDRAKRTIVTGNVVTLIGSVVVYFLAVGDVKGFAFTLGITTVFDIVVSFLVTAPLMIMAARKPFWAKPQVNGLGKVYDLVEERRTESEDAGEEKTHG
ncbi:protein translocase subunit SecD [Corynebacterium pseudodiphtheriticum]|uniref:Protein translocase subunit SecD n=1 Tax=Corynebacterium pseudodiphtheriticum TaxID=37637 RepID=A0AAP4F9F0_9CORY|nr:protein translocase subunit SecD [Corynebacterium pseudodiphtheriticum]MDK4207238.1 protein translocase subunit SecD [Corynebacterium pseudodiphtheriticum]MDK4228716.1 protein translocase subunit SecD [Corynebacterium pseudodiphtheriticum]MDK4237066.1 protein translocase subunit SecD [Corynebacterium pseudodiphtheriticum]MDK4243141.1 protein translocase subunit SecD [Corynebacterium pseudodiphtheriticum]MDK4277513.1 protein translocase subunit SecD [Corynebacterium pseudodiphtheriticum]